MTGRVYIYDSTLRDGAQTQGIDFSVLDKQVIAQLLDKLGVDYIEGGWPGANPTDDQFYANLPELKHSVYTAFGMTRRANTGAGNDPGLNTLINVGTKGVCIVGKSWDHQIETALNIPLDENLKMIEESIAHLVKAKREAMFDCEHFFDGFKANPKYAMKVAETAYKAGARWVILCDTNGGTLPHEIEEIVSKVAKHIPGDHLGIHCHNDTDQGVANSLAAVRAGVRQVQGTINGVGERCGNANLTSIIPTLILKMGFKTGVSKENLKQLTHISRAVQERLNRAPNQYAPYVGSSAFAHKGGLHVSAVAKDPKSYEHVEPESVGNTRNILVSDQAGRSNILARLKLIGLSIDSKDPKVTALVDEVKQREAAGYAYDGADASFELLARRMLSQVPEFYSLQSFRVIDERRYNAKGKLITQSEATMKVKVQGKLSMTVAEGNGPVNALDKALRKALAPKFKVLKDMYLVDYKVRIIPAIGTDALTRVWIESADEAGNHWCTIGVSSNVIDASYNALADSIAYKLLQQS